MLLIAVALGVVIALILLTRRKSAPSAAFVPVAPPKAEGAVDIDEMNRTAKDRRGATVSSRWWNC